MCMVYIVASLNYCVTVISVKAGQTEFAVYHHRPHGFSDFPKNFQISDPILQIYVYTVASSPGSPSPFLTFSRARILYAKNRRRGRAWYGTSPTRTWPPGQGLGGNSLLCTFYCSRAAFWTVLTSLTDNKDYLGES